MSWLLQAAPHLNLCQLLHISSLGQGLPKPVGPMGLQCDSSLQAPGECFSLLSNLSGKWLKVRSGYSL